MTAIAQDPVPLNKVGEEVFGTGYLPEPPGPDAAPLEYGKPSAGIQIPDALQETASRAFTARYGERGLTESSREIFKRLPAQKKFRKLNSLPGYKHVTASIAQPFEALHAEAQASLKVHFVYVGQGAGAILEFPCGVAVIDTGGEWASGTGSVDGEKLFEAALDKFFNERPALNRTIDVLYTSHPHSDHNAGLALISGRMGGAAYAVRNVVDNGQRHEKGTLRAQTDFKDWVQQKGGKYTAVTVDAIRSMTGATNSVIDPFPACKGVDPKITALWGADFEHIKPPIDSDNPWFNPNNHSLVLRIDFGKSSMMFLGDLQTQAGNVLFDMYKDNRDILNVGLYHVSHHGAQSSHLKKLISAMSPEMAIISMGDRKARGRASADEHGHPRKAVVDDLQAGPAAVSGSRQPQGFEMALGQHQFESHRVTRAIYGTGWDGALVVEATADGKYRVISGQQ